jgi:hypothetical protein
VVEHYPDDELSYLPYACWGKPAGVFPNFTLEGVNMGNGERCGSVGRSDWQIRLFTGAGTVAGAAVALLVIKPLVDIPGFWPGLIAFVAVCGVGGVLGRLAGGLLFRPSSGGPPDPPQI